MASFEQQPQVAHRFGVRGIRDKPLDARAQTAVNVELQAGLGVVAREVHLARRHAEMPVREVHQPVGQVARKEGAEVRGAVLAQAPRHVHARVFLAGELDVRIRLVVAQQDVEARFVLLDEVVLECQCLFLVVHQDVVEVARFRDQTAGLGVRQLVFGEVAAHAVAQQFGLADVDDLAGGVLVEVHAGLQRQLRGYLAEVHG